MTSMLLNRNFPGDSGSLIGEGFGASAKRYCWALLIGLLVTLSLFLLMQSLISGADAKITAPTTAANLIFVRLVEDRDTIIKEPKPVPPPPPVVQPTTTFDIPTSPTGIGDDITIKIAPPPTGHRTTIAATDGGILPIVTVSPTYPRRQLAKGVEGWVLLEFSVDQLGRVQNPRVVSAMPASGFSRAALDAVLRYKYKPKVFDGKAIWAHGVQTRMVFQLDNG
jgi:protein TonB